MSEYQYYEFRAVDRALDAAQIKQLRALSSRAVITATGFTNHYEWGDFRGDPDQLMERHFDLFLYLANWGTRQLSLRLPSHLVAAAELKRFLAGDVARLRRAENNLILDICREPEDGGYDDDIGGGDGWLDALANLRADLIDGDLRCLYLIWLMAVEVGDVPDSAVEPLPGIAPLTPALNDFAAFFGIDDDLVAAAVGSAAPPLEPAKAAPLADRIAALSESEKIDLLVRLHDREPHLDALIRRRLRQDPVAAGPAPKRRTAAELRTEAAGRAEARRLAEARQAEAEKRRREKAEAAARQQRLSKLALRGEMAWKDLERLIEDRNKLGYEKATALLIDLRELALARDTDDQFALRLRELRARHARKPQLCKRLDAAGLM